MILVDATALVALGQIGELDLIRAFDGTPAVLPTVRNEVTSERAHTNLDAFVDEGGVLLEDRLPFREDGPTAAVESAVERAMETLREPEYNGDVEIVSAVLAEIDADGPDPGVVSDDRRVRTVCAGLGATVTGTIGVVVRAVEERGLSAEEGRDLVRRVDGHGLHMTGELREKAYELVEDAAVD